MYWWYRLLFCIRNAVYSAVVKSWWLCLWSQCTKLKLTIQEFTRVALPCSKLTKLLCIVMYACSHRDFTTILYIAFLIIPRKEAYTINIISCVHFEKNKLKYYLFASSYIIFVRLIRSARQTSFKLCWACRTNQD